MSPVGSTGYYIIYIWGRVLWPNFLRDREIRSFTVKLHQIQMKGPTCCFNQMRKLKDVVGRLSPFWNGIFSCAMLPMYPYLKNITKILTFTNINIH